MPETLVETPGFTRGSLARDRGYCCLCDGEPSASDRSSTEHIGTASADDCDGIESMTLHATIAQNHHQSRLRKSFFQDQVAEKTGFSVLPPPPRQQVPRAATSGRSHRRRASLGSRLVPQRRPARARSAPPPPTRPGPCSPSTTLTRNSPASCRSWSGRSSARQPGRSPYWGVGSQPPVEARVEA
jgi:hypothetical protein